MFGVGPQEIAVIMLFALIIFGPGKLPEVMREAGKHYKKFKGMADELSGELNKVTREARKELDGALGDLGPMGKDIEKSLGLNKSSGSRSGSSAGRSSSTARKTTSNTSKRSTTSTTTSKKSGTTASKTSTSTKAVTDSRSQTSAKTTTKRPVASKEDPLADFGEIEVQARTVKRRSRSATPSAISDLTPRTVIVEEEPIMATVATASKPRDLSELNDPLERVRARRRTAGYARI